MDSIWFKFSVEAMMTNGHGRKVRRSAQGEKAGAAREDFSPIEFALRATLSAVSLPPP